MPEIYGTRAELYDLLYHFKDYAAEARRVDALLSGLGVAPGGRVLEGAVGTGGHAVHLAARYAWSGFDASAGMIEAARRKLPPGTPLSVADLRSFEALAADAFVCLFSSIGYLIGPEALASCAAAVARAVRPGGALIVEPWFPPERWDAGRPTVQVYDAPDLKIVRATVAEREGDVAVTPMTYLVARRGHPVETFSEVHRLWLAPTEALVAAFDLAGFDARFDPAGLTDGRGLVLGTRRA